MPRIEIELTSSRPDGVWTWRAAGARQPKGTLDGQVLPPGISVGDRVRAEVEIDLDGHRVHSVTALKAKAEDPSRLTILGSGREVPGVTTDMRGGLAGADRRPARPRREGDRRDGERREGRRPPGRDGDGGRRPRPEGRSAGGDSRPGGQGRGGPERTERSRHGEPTRRDGRGEQGTQSRPEGWKSARPARERARPARPAPAPPPKAKRLSPRRTHRDLVLADVAPELRPVAEKVLRGGVAAVRAALDEQNAAARAAGAAEVRAEGLLAVAEELVPRLRVAEWWDRAEAALADVDEISVRDLRSVVAGSDAARDDETRALAASLREALARRLAAEAVAWVAEIESCLDEGRVVRALRLSARPPEPTTRMSAELATRLSDSAGQALGPDNTTDRWVAVVEAVAASPVRRTVQARGLPGEGGPVATKAAHEAASRVPSIAKLLGIPAGVPLPPPGRRRPARPAPSPAVSGDAASAASGDDGDDPVLVEELGQPVDQG